MSKTHLLRPTSAPNLLSKGCDETSYARKSATTSQWPLGNQTEKYHFWSKSSNNSIAGDLKLEDYDVDAVSKDYNKSTDKHVLHGGHHGCRGDSGLD
jgi:hypothetical protein